MFYVTVFNDQMVAFECIGAFSKEDEASTCLAAARLAWEEKRGDDPRLEFPGGYYKATWKEFGEKLIYEHLGELADLLKALLDQKSDYVIPA